MASRNSVVLRGERFADVSETTTSRPGCRHPFGSCSADAGFSQVLGNPTLQRILMLFACGAGMSVGEVAERVAISQATASQQFALLQPGESGSSRRDARRCTTGPTATAPRRPRADPATDDLLQQVHRANHHRHLSVRAARTHRRHLGRSHRLRHCHRPPADVAAELVARLIADHPAAKTLA